MDPVPPQSAGAAAPSIEAPQQDLSSRTIVLLVILTLVVSFIGAWMNVQQALVYGNTPAETPGVDQSSAKVSFVITKDAPKTDASTGMVTLGIRPPQ